MRPKHTKRSRAVARTLAKVFARKIYHSNTTLSWKSRQNEQDGLSPKLSQD